MNTGGGGGGFDTDEEGEDETEPVLPPIKSIFDCPYIVKTVVNDGKPGWDCLWCGKKIPQGILQGHSVMF